MQLLEPIPDEIQNKIRSLLPLEELVLIRVSTDLNQDRSFGTQWMAVTDKRILVIPTENIDNIVEFPLKEVISVHTEPLVGGGRLEIEREDGATIFIPYSSSLAVKFSEVARGIEQLRKGELFLIKADLDRIRCEKCGRLLPEKNGICPACIQRLATLRRIGRISQTLQGSCPYLGAGLPDHYLLGANSPHAHPSPSG